MKDDGKNRRGSSAVTGQGERKKTAGREQQDVEGK